MPVGVNVAPPPPHDVRISGIINSRTRPHTFGQAARLRPRRIMASSPGQQISCNPSTVALTTRFSADGAVVATVNVIAVPALPAAMDAGEKLQVVCDGKPPHVNETTSGNFAPPKTVKLME